MGKRTHMRRRRKDHRLNLLTELPHRLCLLYKPPKLPPTLSLSISNDQETEWSESLFPKVQLCCYFTIAQIRLATQNFNPTLLIDRYGNVYKGTIENRTVTAIKRWTSASGDQFQAEVKILDTLRHRNIVTLIGYCNNRKDMIIVYEYMSNGTLWDHLHMYRTPLCWSQRLKICIDVVGALEYLHNGASGQEVIHGNVSSSNILLDDHFAAKITDFESSKIIPLSSSTAGLRKKSDVYSFGVVLLEILCRRRAVDMSLDEEQRILVGWAQDYMRKGEIEQIVDPELRGQTSINSLIDYTRIVEACLHESQELHITMAEVLVGVKSILVLHERTNNPIPQKGITTPVETLRKYFFSSEQISGRNYFGKDIKLLSAESHQHKGDHGHMSDSVPEADADAISEESYQQEISLMHSKGELIDGEFLSRDPTKYLYESTQLGCIQRADTLMRMKDFLHLIWCYPVKKEAEVNFGSLVGKYSLLNEYVRKSLDSSRDANYLEIQTLIQDIEEDLDEAAFDMVAYLPEGSFESFVSFWSRIPEIHASTIASATHRAVNCIKDLKVKMLGIWGSGAGEVAKTLTELAGVFDMVLCVRAKHHSINELMNNIEEEIHRWKKTSSKTADKSLLFIDCSDDFIDLHELGFSLSKWSGSLQIVMTSGSQNAYCPVDMEIRVEDHLLP